MNSWFLSTISFWPLILGLVIVVAGIALLYRAWQKPQRQWSLVSLGWISLLLVHWPLGLALGFDRGWAFAAILPGFIALLWIGMTTPWQGWNYQSKQTPAKESKPIIATAITTRTRVNQTGQVLLQVLVIGILSFAAALGVALALFSVLDISVADRTIYSALWMMVLWPILMVWGKAKASLLKPALYFVGITLGGLLFTPAFF